jgi:hypothetical protein
MSSLETPFVYEVSGEVMAKFHQKPVLYRKVSSAINIDAATGQVSDCRNSQTANRLMSSNGSSES